MPLIHNGAAFWRTPEQRGSDPLDRYFSDAAEHPGSLTEPAAIALERWPRVLRPSVDDQADRRPLWERLRGYAEAAIPARPYAPRRCIFVSHRQSDSLKAVHLANAILAYHPNDSDPYDVWLDVWDPALVGRLAAVAGLDAATLTALIIEMGLINSVAVIALMTNCSYGSGWIPYEFGRVKTGGPFAREASTCLRDLNRPLLDYMILAPQINYANGQYQGLDDWLDRL